MKTDYKYTNIFYKVICLLLAAVLSLSLIMTGTLAWCDFSQHKANMASGSNIRHTVLLQKYEKDADGVITTTIPIFLGA